MLHAIWFHVMHASVMIDAGRLMAINPYRAHAAAMAGVKGDLGRGGAGHWHRVAVEIARRRRRLPPLWSRCM